MKKKSNYKMEYCINCGAEFRATDSPKIWARGQICAGAFEDTWLMCQCPHCHERHHIRYWE